MNLMFRKLNRVLCKKIYQLKLLNPTFFNDVYIVRKNDKKFILDWLFGLHYYKHISISQFSDLFNEFNDISFPIKISLSSFGKLYISDNRGNDYYLLYSYDELEEYTIGKREYPFDKYHVFRLTTDSTIILKEFGIMLLNKDKTNTDTSLTFHYDLKKQLTTAVLKTSTSTLEIVYPSINCRRDNEISMHLFNLSTQFKYVDDLFSVWNHLPNELKLAGIRQSLRISSFMNIEDNTELLSELNLFNGIVTRYSSTTRSDSKICFTRQILSESLEYFLSNHKHYH